MINVNIYDTNGFYAVNYNESYRLFIDQFNK